jgi:capsular exopolysaccharide synthesis family protein
MSTTTTTELEHREGALGPYLRAIRARKVLVACLTLLAAAVAVAFLAIRTPSYEAETQLLVTPLPQDDRTFLGIELLRDSGDPTRTVQTAATLIESPRAAAATARAVGTGLTADDVEGSVEIEPLGESNVVAVVASAPAAELAARTSRQYAQQAITLRNQDIQGAIEAAIAALRDSDLDEDQQRLRELLAVRERGDPTLSVAQGARVPEAPIGAPAWLVLALALVAGFTVGTVTALLMERLDRRVGDQGELLAIWPLPVLTRVPRALDVADGGALATPPPVREAFRTLQLQLGQRGNRHRLILITSASSGDGKTTSALALAAALVGGGSRVLLVDFDLRKPDLQRRLKLEDQGGGLISLLTSNATIAQTARPVAGLRPLRFLPGGGKASDVPLLQALGRRLESVLDQAFEIADYVIVDTPPLGEVGDALALLSVADEILVVGRPGNTDRARVETTRDLLERAGATPTGWILFAEPEAARSSYYYAENGDSGARHAGRGRLRARARG